MKVYLAGPITDCDRGEANDWRAYAVDRLAEHGLVGMSPLRCEPLIGERYSLGNQDPRFGTARAIASKNFLDVQMCDVTLCYLMQDVNARRLSVGTVIELAWAHALRKPTILVSDYEFLVEHPVVQACAGWIVSTLDEGLDIAVGVLEGYVN